MAIKDLSPAQCILLTAHLAAESNIQALYSFTPQRLDALDPELILRILLTYLPEALDPREYADYVSEVASRLYLDVDRKEVEVNLAPVQDIPPGQAEKRVRKLRLLALQPPAFSPHAPKDILTRFLCHRAYKIDAETGLLNLIPTLIEPFLRRNDYLRTWYVTVVLPLLRMEVEYYPQAGPTAMPLADFEKLSGREGTDFLLGKAISSARHQISQDTESKPQLGRDIKGLIGPWMYGHTERVYRRLARTKEVDDGHTNTDSTSTSGATTRTSKIALTGVTAEDRTGHDWEHLYRWIVFHSTEDFGLIASAIEEWGGPSDIDCGGFDTKGIVYLDEDLQSKLDAQYAQAAFASCYAAQADDAQTVRDAHSVLARLAELLDFIPPPDLATSVDALPRIERHTTKLEASESTNYLRPASLLQSEHPLTTPRLETYMLLQMMVYSAYQFANMGHPLSLFSVAKLHFYATADEQLATLRSILKKLSQAGTRRNETQWTEDRAKLLWLWNWGIEPEDDNSTVGYGALGNIEKDIVEQEMLKTLIDTNGYQMVVNIYLLDRPQPPLALPSAEAIILAKAMEAYDGASNCNRTRGGMQKANEIIKTFEPYFQNSIGFRQATALISATHSLSFYSLTLQHGVPFKPVSIRVSEDPISLITKVLEQNPRSYSKLDDLISIAQNLVLAGLLQPEPDSNIPQDQSPDLPLTKKYAERRVTFMAIEAALRENDFETAYSYTINRLTPSGADAVAPTRHSPSPSTSTSSPKPKRHMTRPSLSKPTPEDDISWRAAFLAGRYRPSSSAAPTLRRLEQRTELLSLALLLAPASALTEILAAWRRCEEESLSLLAAQQADEQAFDDRADKRLSGNMASFGASTPSSALPGHFVAADEQPALVLNQQRRELGRMGRGGVDNSDETPLSMFDLTRNAARAFSNNAFIAGREGGKGRGNTGSALGESSPRPSGEEEGSGGERPWSPSGDGQRVRKRDMVANAVSGGLASGLGWMLGATPANQPQGQQQQQQR